MVRRAMTLLTSAVLLVGLTVAALAIPVPYVVASPGLALNTLGELDGEQVIQIEGHPVHEHDGALSMVTVQYSGGPDSRMNLFTTLSAWLSPTQAVLPEEAIFPPNTSAEEVSQTQAAQMDNSQDAAVAAAFNELGIDTRPRPCSQQATGRRRPAVRRRHRGGRRQAVADKNEVVAAVKDRSPGDGPLPHRTRRPAGRSQRARSLRQRRLIVITVEDTMVFRSKCRSVSAEWAAGGMMFALGVMDRLDPEGLTGGHRIAGTGTIDPEGNVGGVSGVQQKMISAKREGAEYFLVAAESCDQTFDSPVTGQIEVVKVETLKDAVAALENIREGNLDDLPRC